MATFLPRLLERLNAPIVSSRLDSDDLAYLSKYESEISDSDNLSNINSDDTACNGNFGTKYETYLSSLNSHVVDQYNNYSYPVKYTNKIIRNDSGLTYRRTTSSISNPLVDYIQKSDDDTQDSLDSRNSSTEIGTTTSNDSDHYKKQTHINKPLIQKSIEKSKNIDNNEKVVWEPGFTRQLGTKGRRVLLDLIRKVYRSNPEYYKRLLELKTPPTSISNLPFCNIIMLWELANDFGVFDQAMLIHYTHTKPAYQSNFNTNSNHNPNKVRKTQKTKKVKYYEYEYEPYDDEQYEDEYISSFSNSKTSRGRKITQPKRYDDYDHVVDGNYKYNRHDLNYQYDYDYPHNNHHHDDDYYYKNGNHNYLSLSEFKGHKIERLSSPLIF